MPTHRRELSHIFTHYRRFRDANQPIVFVLGRTWEENWSPETKPPTIGENIQTPHTRKKGISSNPQLWRYKTNMLTINTFLPFYCKRFILDFNQAPTPRVVYSHCTLEDLEVLEKSCTLRCCLTNNNQHLQTNLYHLLINAASGRDRTWISPAGSIGHNSKSDPLEGFSVCTDLLP